MKNITIVSGKGGVGKSMIASSISVMLSREMKVVVADCDVDAPDLGLSLGLNDNDYESWNEITTNEKAVLVDKKCTGCRKCVDVCTFGAIKWDEKRKKPVFNSLFCEGCGSCELVCPENAIELKEVNNAVIGIGKTAYGFPIITGQLKMGESGSGKVIFIVKETAMKMAERERAEIMLTDAAAGIGCPVIASVRGSDYVIAVTEPTPSALSDVIRMLDIVKHFDIEHGLVINKFDLNPEFSEKIEKFAKSMGISVLGKIPYDRKFVDAIVNRKPAVIYDKQFENVFNEIIDNMKNAIGI
ncbi:MAG: ATP-binding protein [Candidatus Aenigmarchaeota archaeon]|nr:ATP-binding protein [Candidatus Aenigmarchaeota archaeon]